MRSYGVTMKLTTERKSLDSVESKLARVREVLDRQGFHISELRIRDDESGKTTEAKV